MRATPFAALAFVCAASANAADVDLYVDNDWDGVVEGDDADDDDACVPNVDSGRCDKDGDGVDNGLERGRGTDEDDADSDGDGVSDLVEGDEDTNDNGVIDALDRCAPGVCSDEDAVEYVVVEDAGVVDGPGGCQQSEVSPAAALVLLLMAFTSSRRRTAAQAARRSVRLTRWQA